MDLVCMHRYLSLIVMYILTPSSVNPTIHTQTIENSFDVEVVIVCHCKLNGVLIRKKEWGKYVFKPPIWVMMSQDTVMLLSVGVVVVMI